MNDSQYTGLLIAAVGIALFLAAPALAQTAANFSGANGGSVRVGADSNTCDSSKAGAVRYMSNKVSFCDASAWRELVPVGQTANTPIFAAGAGFFVVTNGTWDGNLGGLSGANAKCLTDLTNNDWMGKSTAQAAGIFIAAKVRAWLCDTGTCNNVTALVPYYFAKSGETATGGATITPGGSSNMGASVGSAHNPDGNQWSALNYFNNDYQYWTNRSSSLASASVTPLDTSDACSGFTSNSNAAFATVGRSSTNNNSRWDNGAAVACNNTRHLICLVGP